MTTPSAARLPPRRTAPNRESAARSRGQTSRRHTLSVFVRDKPGVLIRIGQIFSRRGYNIENFIVNPSATDGISRTIITCTGDHEELGRIVQQLRKQVDVVHATDHTGHTVCETEVALIKLAPPPGRWELLSHALRGIGAEIVHRFEDTVIVRLHGDRDSLDADLEALRPFSVLEMARSGRAIMAVDASPLPSTSRSEPDLPPRPRPE